MRKIFLLLSFIFSTYAENLEDLLERCYPTSIQNEDSCAVKIHNFIFFGLAQLEIIKTIQICKKPFFDSLTDTFPGTCGDDGQCEPTKGSFVETAIEKHVGKDVAHSIENFCSCAKSTGKVGVFCDQDLRRDFKVYFDPD